MGYDSWRIAIDFAALALAAVSMAYAHWRTRTRATQQDIEALETEAQGLRDRVVRIEARLEDTPSTKALHELSIAIEHIGGDLKATVARMDGLGEIVKRLDRITERQETYLLNKGPGQ